MNDDEELEYCHCRDDDVCRCYGVMDPVNLNDITPRPKPNEARNIRYLTAVIVATCETCRDDLPLDSFSNRQLA